MVEVRCHMLVFALFGEHITAEWVALPPVPSATVASPRVAHEDIPCPDIHNLTMAMWSKPTVPMEDWRSVGEQELNEFARKVKKQVPRTAAGKYEFLKSIEKNLLANIEEKIEEFGQVRSARGKLLPEIPREAALITISLLLFAVYLIKLILKVLEKLHKKKEELGLYSTGLNNVRLPQGVVTTGRKRRDLEYQWEMTKLQLNHLIHRYDHLQ